MKKNKIGLLTLASCVLLSGCSLLPNLDFDWLPGDKQEEEKPAEPSEPTEQEDVVKINIDNVPKEIYLGEDLDLSQYVELENATKFTLSLSDESYDVANQSGKVITPVAEGEITYIIKCGDVTKEGTVKALSSLRKDLKKAAEKFKTKYSFLGNKGNSTYSLTTHTDQYIYKEAFDYDDDDNDIAGGYVEALDGLTYTYNVINDRIVFSRTTSEPKIEKITGDLRSLLELEYTYDVETNMLIARPDEEGKLNQVLKGVFHNDVNFSSLSAYDLDSLRIGKETIIVPVNESTAEEVECLSFIIYLSKGNSLLYWSYDFLAPEYFTFEPLDALLEEGLLPTSQIDAGEVFGVALDEVISNGNFQVSYDSYFFDKSLNRRIPNPYGGKECEDLIVHSYATATAEVYVTPNQILKVVDGEESLTEGLVVHDGVIYSYFPREGEFLTEEVMEGTDLFDPAIPRKDNMTFMGKEKGSELWESIFVNEVKLETAKEYVAEWQLATSQDLFYYFCNTALNQTEHPEGDEDIVSLTSTVDRMLDSNYELYADTVCTATINYKSNKVTSVTFEFVIEFTEDIYHEFKITIGNVGKTIIPDGFEIFE